MKASFLGCLSMVAVVAALAGCGGGEAKKAEESPDVRPAAKAVIDAINVGNVDAAADNFADDGVMEVTPKPAVQGKENIKALLKNLLKYQPKLELPEATVEGNNLSGRLTVTTKSPPLTQNPRLTATVEDKKVKSLKIDGLPPLP